MRILVKRTFLFVIAALQLSATICSCSREDDPEEQREEQEDKKVEDWENVDMSGDAIMESAPMRFFVGNNEGETRSTTTYAGVCKLTEGDLVSVGITRSGESEIVKLYRLKSDGYLEYAGTDNEPFLWKRQSEQVSIRAWSYGTSTQTENTLTPPESYDYSLETDQQTNGYNELLYCKVMDKKCSDGTITFTFYHQLARVVFNVKHELENDLSVTSHFVGQATSFPVVARFAIPEGNSNVGTWTTKGTYNTIIPKTETTQSGYRRTYSVVVFPSSYGAATTLLTIKNSDGDYVYKTTSSGSTTLNGGNQYFYTITVKNGFVQDFSYKNSAQTFTTPYAGKYRIECWGASGGGAVIGDSESGGCGSYVSGEISLTKSQELYVYTGQKGKGSDVYSSDYMFNGGGYAQKTDYGYCGSCGGGATDIRTTSGAWDNSTSLNSRIMIAAGGGGAKSGGGNAGGINGYDGVDRNTPDYSQYCGKGATQTRGGVAPNKYESATSNGTAGTLGKGGLGGASASGSGHNGGGSGGGGGLYGGSGASGLSRGTWTGGGGSSYISGHNGCTAKTLTFSSTVMIDGAGYQWTTAVGSYVGIPTIDDASEKTRGYIGNGYCRITRIGY